MANGTCRANEKVKNDSKFSFREYCLAQCSRLSQHRRKLLTFFCYLNIILRTKTSLGYARISGL